MSLTLTDGWTIFAIIKFSIKKIPGCMTYIVHPDIACMMLKRHSILNMVTDMVSSTENKIDCKITINSDL
jgi:hypothetical protein